MNRLPASTAAFALLALLLSGCANLTGQLTQEQDALASTQEPVCSGYELELWKPLPPGSGAESDTVDSWTKEYHERVDSIISQYEGIPPGDIQCLEEDVLTAPEPLAELAALLPPWAENQAALSALSRKDLGPVLLEYLRTYECALHERNLFLPIDVRREMREEGTELRQRELLEEYLDQRRKIGKELAIARPALHRTLSLLGPRQRYDQISAEMHCLEAVSLDIRNALGLSTEAAACLPRIWDARDSLRDYPNQ